MYSGPIGDTMHFYLNVMPNTAHCKCIETASPQEGATGQQQGEDQRRNERRAVAGENRGESEGRKVKVGRSQFLAAQLKDN